MVGTVNKISIKSFLLLRMNFMNIGDLYNFDDTGRGILAHDRRFPESDRQVIVRS